MKRSKKVIHLLYSGLGGHSAVFFSLAGADQLNSYTHIAFFGGVEPLNADSAERCQKNNIQYRSFLKKRGFDLKYYLTVFKALAKEKPAILFLHSTGFLIPAFFLRLIMPGTKMIIRDTQAAHLKRRSEWWFLALAHLRSDKTVFLTKEAAESLREKFPIFYSVKKVAIIANGLNISAFSEEGARAGQVFRLGMQSRLQSIKDHPSLIKAFAEIKKIYPHIPLQLHIAGEGSTLSQLQQLVTELEVEKDVIFHGMLNQPQLINFLHRLDIYVHATFGETMSNSILQAMACGLPVIASDVWGVNNMIDDGRTGLLYRSGDVRHLTGQISCLINDPVLAAKLGHAARQEVERCFDANMMFKKYEAIFKELGY